MKKQILFLVTSLAMAGMMVAAGCNDGQTGHDEHNWVLDTEKTVPATCGEGTTGYYYCECGEEKTEYIPATGNHSYDGNGQCTVCGYIDMSGMTEKQAVEKYGFYHVDADSSRTFNTGDKVSFGSYPQKIVEDSSVLTKLGAEQGTLPTAESSGDWTSYEYYAEDEKADYMFYKDVEVDGTNYRGVYLLGYRPYYSGLETSEDYTYVDDLYDLNKVYWFEYSSISWSVLDYSDGSLFLAADYCLEGQPFQTLYEDDGNGGLVIPGTDVCVNDWEHSSLRTFLNEDFYNLAFSASERQMINTTKLVNKGYGETTVNDTNDKVFLLSYEDVGKAEYGFTSAKRSRSYTDYSTIQGLRPSTQGSTADGEPTCYYVLRSAGDKGYVVSGVSKQGVQSYVSRLIQVGDTESYDGYAINGDLGVLPALYLNIFNK